MGPSGKTYIAVGLCFDAVEQVYKGVLCMEHGKSKPGKEGEKALIEAYRQVDDF